jgi:acyl-CoA synthetase (AMP-forming)/AMP-acid ligase II
MAEPLWGDDEERFEEIARLLFAHQFEACAPYRRFCEGRGVTPAALESWRAIPAVPTGSFKEVALRSFPPERTVHTFRTSGTSTPLRGELHLDTLALYEASLLPTFCRFLLPDLTEQRPEATILVLAPSPAEARDSSLSHMFAVAIREVGAQGSGFFIEQEELELDRLRSALEEASPEIPLLVCGTSFAFVHWLDALEADGERLALPDRARIMETGGFKGRSRSLPRPALYGALEERLGVDMDRIVNQYGMTELASQFYDGVLREPGAPRRKLGPPWTRVRLIDPESGEECAEGQPGVVVVTDLANTGSVIAIQTADLGQRVGDGFEVLGREPGAEARGCSIAADELLGGANT